MNALQQPTQSLSRRKMTRHKTPSRRSETEIASGTPMLTPERLNRSKPTMRAPPSPPKPTAVKKSSGFPRQKSPNLRRTRVKISQLPPRSNNDSDASAAKTLTPHRKGLTLKPATAIRSLSTSTLKRKSSILHVIRPRPIIMKKLKKLIPRGVEVGAVVAAVRTATMEAMSGVAEEATTATQTRRGSREATAASSSNRSKTLMATIQIKPRKMRTHARKQRLLFAVAGKEVGVEKGVVVVTSPPGSRVKIDPRQLRKLRTRIHNQTATIRTSANEITASPQTSLRSKKSTNAKWTATQPPWSTKKRPSSTSTS